MITHAEDLLVILTLCVVTVGVAAVVTVVAWYRSHWIISDSDYFYLNRRISPLAVICIGLTPS